MPWLEVNSTEIGVCDYNSLQSTGSIWDYENIKPSHTETLDLLFNKKKKHSETDCLCWQGLIKMLQQMNWNEMKKTSNNSCLAKCWHLRLFLWEYMHTFKINGFSQKKKKQKTGTGQIFNLYLKTQKVAYNQLIKMEQNNGIHLKAFNFQQKKWFSGNVL